MKIKFLSKREINSLIEELNNISLIPDLPKIKQVKSFELTDLDPIIIMSKFYPWIINYALKKGLNPDKP